LNAEIAALKKSAKNDKQWCSHQLMLVLQLYRWKTKEVTLRISEKTAIPMLKVYKSIPLAKFYFEIFPTLDKDFIVQKYPLGMKPTAQICFCR